MLAPENQCSLDERHPVRRVGDAERARDGVGENRIAHGLQPWEDGPERNRPERAAEGRSLFPKITFVESDLMAFQKLTKLFLIRKFAVMLGLIGNVGGNGLYARLAD